jgi:IS5 family transposase
VEVSDVAIETALTLRLLFHLPLRQTEGFLHSLFGMMGSDLSAPDHTTLSRRGQHLDLERDRVSTGRRVHLIVDSTGRSILGEEEWAAAKHGGHGKRGWKKLHLGVDRSGVIVAHALTEATTDDATMTIELIQTVDGCIASVTGDAAYDSIAYDAACARGASVVVPPAKTARVCRRRPRSSARDRTIQRSWRRSVGDGGRRYPATIGRPAWRTPSSGISRSSGMAFERAVQQGRRLRRSSHATSSIR